MSDSYKQIYRDEIRSKEIYVNLIYIKFFKETKLNYEDYQKAVEFIYKEKQMIIILVRVLILGGIEGAWIERGGVVAGGVFGIDNIIFIDLNRLDGCSFCNKSLSSIFIMCTILYVCYISQFKSIF